MRKYSFVALLLISLSVSAQSRDEASVLKLSEKVFQWEVANRLDSVARILDAQLVVVGSDGNTRNKEQYMQRLGDGSFVHNGIKIEDSKATVTENTAIVVGKGRFTITSSGSQNTAHLSYLEVFVRRGNQAPWTLLAIKASVLPN